MQPHFHGTSVYFEASPWERAGPLKRQCSPWGRRCSERVKVSLEQVIRTSLQQGHKWCWKQQGAHGTQWPRRGPG